MVEESQGKYRGFDKELMDMIAQDAGFTLAYVEIADWAMRFEDLAEGKYDILISRIEKSPQNKPLHGFRSAVTFSSPYFNGGQAIAVLSGGSISRVDDLDGKTVGFQSGGTQGEQWVQDKEHPEWEITLLDELVTDKFYRIATSKAYVSNMIEESLQRVMATQAYWDLYHEWFGAAEVCFRNLTEAEPAPTPPDDTPTPAESPSPGETPTPTESAEPTQPPAMESKYTIQAGDWLSKIAAEKLGNPRILIRLYYRAIEHYTNGRCGPNSGYNCIDDANKILPGWVIYLPTDNEIDAFGFRSAFTPVGLPEIEWPVEGDIVVSGSSTVFPLSDRIKALFESEQFDGNVEILRVGTMESFKALCLEGTSDVANASDMIDPMTINLRILIRACESNRFGEPFEFRVGIDAIAIVVSADNFLAQDNLIDDLTHEELIQILSTAQTWKDVRDTWEALPIRRYYPPWKTSGTHKFLVGKLFAGDSSQLRDASNIVMETEEYDDLADAVTADPLGVGFFGHAYYRQRESDLRPLPVNGVVLRYERVDDRSYPLTRPLFIYSTDQIMQEKPQVAAFINFYLRRVTEEIEEVGYFLPTEDELQQAWDNYSTAMRQ